MKSKQIQCLVGAVIFLAAAVWLSAPLPALCQTRGPDTMFGLYAENRDKGMANYITEDFLLLAYAMVLERQITHVEESILFPKYRALVDGLSAQLPPDASQDSAHQGVRDFLRVLKCLLEGKTAPESAPRPDKVAAELKRIRAAEGILPSDLMGQTVDYTQFQIRGKYSTSENLGRYFQAMKYAGTVFFPVKESKATGIDAKTADRLTDQALVMARLLTESPMAETYQDMEAVLFSLFGPGDDLSPRAYMKVENEMPNAATAQKRAALLLHAQKTNTGPRIISGRVKAPDLEKGVTPADVMTGFRFIPQRFTPDSAVFQCLVYDAVKKYRGEKKPFTLSVIDGVPVKGFPRAHELMALLGSISARKHLEKGDDTNYEGYEEAMKKARQVIWTPAGMSSLHLALMSHWLKNTGPNLPDDETRLTTCLGFWTQMRHGSILYAKQSYTMAGKGLSLPGRRDFAWITPAPALFLFLENGARKLAPLLDGGAMAELARLLEKCRLMAKKAEQDMGFSGDEIRFLNNLDQSLLGLTDGPDAPVVADVHTDPSSGMVLEQGVGPPVAVFQTVRGTKTRGARFCHYEFKHPLAQRLTDEKWREMVRNPKQLKKRLEQ